jgi:xanthine dehydrogenase accessory factor
MLEIISTVNEWLQSGQKVALATVVETWGSAPRRAGSKMAIRADMAMVGSVSGGCIEVAVIEEALEILNDGTPRLLKYGVSDDTAWSVGLTCGGKIAVFVESLDLAWWALAVDAVQQDRHAVTVTALNGADMGRKLFVDGGGAVGYSTFGAEVGTYADAALGAATPQMITMDGAHVMLDVHPSRPHLIIIGGVHVAQPLQSFARQLGFRVSLVDPRGVFASAERFPDVDAISHRYPDKALPELGLNSNTYVAVLTHDPKIDDKALLAALPSPAPYVGVLSSRKTHEARVARLEKAGIAQRHIERIYTPIGIPIDAQTPEQIALSIMAEIVAVRNRQLAAQPAPKVAQAVS